jgi:hypothetical protein
MGLEVSKPTRPQAPLLSHPGQRVKKRSASRAEYLIADVEKLYNFGHQSFTIPWGPAIAEFIEEHGGAVSVPSVAGRFFLR